jgi:hypothetical protein
LIGRYPLIVSKIISHFACAARQGLSFAAGLQGKIYYQCNCDLNNSDKYPKDSSVAQLFGTITSLALPPFTVPQRLHAFQTINHLIQHACLGFNPIGKQEISDLLVRSIESSCRWIRKASTELYQVAARADLLDISLHKKIIQLAKNPENADEIISIALSLLSVTNTHSEIECDAGNAICF